MEAPGDSAVPKLPPEGIPGKIPPSDLTLRLSAPPTRLTAEPLAAPRGPSTFTPASLSSAGSALAEMAEMAGASRAGSRVSFAESSSSSQVAQHPEGLALQSRKDTIIRPPALAATSVTPTITSATSEAARTRIPEAVTAWMLTPEIDAKKLAAKKNGANAKTKKLQSALEATTPEDKNVRKLQKKVVQSAVKESSKDPLLAKEILKILAQDNDPDRSKDIAKEIVEASAKSREFELVVLDYVKEYITQMGKEGRTTLFRQTEGLPARIITALQNARLKPILAVLEPIMAKITSGVSSGTLDVAKTGEEVTAIMTTLTSSMTKIDPILAELYRHLHSEVKAKHGQAVADRLLVASFIFLKTITPFFVNPREKTPITPDAASHMRLLAAVLQFLVNYEGIPSDSPTLTKGTPSLSDFVAENHATLFKPFLDALKTACFIP